MPNHLLHCDDTMNQTSIFGSWTRTHFNTLEKKVGSDSLPHQSVKVCFRLPTYQIHPGYQRKIYLKSMLLEGQITTAGVGGGRVSAYQCKAVGGGEDAGGDVSRALPSLHGGQVSGSISRGQPRNLLERGRDLLRRRHPSAAVIAVLRPRHCRPSAPAATDADGRARERSVFAVLYRLGD
jgi:hypothetical protein